MFCFLMLGFGLNILIDMLLFQSVFGALKVTAYSSGFSLGSCNWLVESEFEKVKELYDSFKILFRSVNREVEYRFG